MLASTVVGGGDEGRARARYMAMMGEGHPLPLGVPADVVNCIVSLASDEARLVAGPGLACDGGYTAQ